MNILYLHGLESKLSHQKRKIIERYGNVFAPELDYHNNAYSIENIIQDYSSANVQAVIGSSMGGFAGYYVSTALRCPALLFNPALKQRSVEQHIPLLEDAAQNYKRIVQGLQDDVVDPSHTLSFLADNLYKGAELDISLRSGMTHSVEITVFKKELKKFFTEI